MTWIMINLPTWGGEHVDNDNYNISNYILFFRSTNDYSARFFIYPPVGKIRY